MNIKEKIICLNRLGQWIQENPTELQGAVTQTYLHNRWFTKENTYQALKGIATNFLDRDKLSAWVEAEELSGSGGKKIGLILAGNIPLVGFHDWLSVIIAGHFPQIKLSDKDKFLLPLLNKYLKEIGFDTQTNFVERLKDFDGVIATGSNNTARYFETYFGKYPHIIRKNRNGLAVLSGDETKEELIALGADIFSYFGLGCRSTAKLYLPKGYDFDPLHEAFRAYEAVIHHNKYKNNFDYNYTLIIMNKMAHKSNGVILLLEDPAMASRIATLHFEYYTDAKTLGEKLKAAQSDIQCISSNIKFDDITTIDFGAAQNPTLDDYADGVNTLTFLKQL